MDRDEIKQLIRSGRTPHDVWVATSNSREAYLIAIEEEARQAGEFNAFEPTPKNVVELRDGRAMRWERIAVRVIGEPRRTQAVRDLYDEDKGPGASKRSYTGRGRRFPDMQDHDVPIDHAAPAPEPPASLFFGVTEERAASPERLAEIDVLREGSDEDIRKYLESHLHSDRFYIDGDRIWLELPNRIDAPPRGTVLVWFQSPDRFEVIAPAAGSPAGLHAIPAEWDTTLCTIPLSSWSSGVRMHTGADVTCRWCKVRLFAAKVAELLPTELNPHRPAPAQVRSESRVAESFAAFVDDFIPRLRQSHPNAQRLDGRTSGSTWDVMGKFKHHDKTWQIHGDTRVEPVLIAYEEAKNGRDPFMEAQTRAGRNSLELTPELRSRMADPSVRHLYIYEN